MPVRSIALAVILLAASGARAFAATVARPFTPGRVSAATAGRLVAAFSLRGVDAADPRDQARLTPLLDALEARGISEDLLDDVAYTDRYIARTAASIKVRAWAESRLKAAAKKDIETLAEAVGDLDEVAAALPLYRVTLGDGLDDARATHVTDRWLWDFNDAAAQARARLAVVRARTPLGQAEAMLAGKQPVEAPLRPASEAWTLGERSFGSTAELVAHLRAVPQPAQELEATYHFGHRPGAGLTRFSGIGKVYGAAWRGAAFGVPLGASLMQLFAFVLMPFQMVGGMIMVGEWHAWEPRIGLAEFFAAAPAFLGGGVMAGLFWSLLSLVGAGSFDVIKNGGSISGKLALEEDLFGRRVLFTPEGKPGARIDLATHSTAPSAQAPKAEFRWYDNVLGAGLMLLASLSVFAPLYTGVLVTASLAFYAGYRVAMGTRLNQFIAGLVSALLMLAWLTVLVGGHPFWPQFTLGVLLVGLPIGALWGLLALPLIRRGSAFAGAVEKQWWYRS